MADPIIPEIVKAFIAEHIDSLVSLEILLLLHGSPQREFSADDVAHELGIEVSWAAPLLAYLRTKGILISLSGPEPRYRFEPAAPALRQTIDQLAFAYATYRVRVTTLIFAKPSDALRSFADAFRLRKDHADG